MSSLCCYKQGFVDGWSALCSRGKASMAWWLAARLVTRASVKGKLGEQAWLTRVPWLVRLAPEECDSLDILGGQAWLTQVPCLVRLVPKECDSLQDNVPCRSLEGSGHKRLVWNALACGGKASLWLGICS